MIQIYTLVGDIKKREFFLWTASVTISTFSPSSAHSFEGKDTHHVLETALNYLENRIGTIVTVIRCDHRKDTEYVGVKNLPAYYRIIVRHKN